MKYLTLIAAITLLHQHQRPVRTASRGEAVIRYVETTPADIALADKLAARVLAQSLDELPPGTRRLLDAIAGYVSQRSRAEGTDPGLVRFTRRQLREALPLGDSQLKVHLARLADYELVIARWTGAGGFCYELAWQPECPAGSAGDAAMTPARPGSEGSRPGAGRGVAQAQRPEYLRPHLALGLTNIRNRRDNQARMLLRSSRRSAVQSRGRTEPSQISGAGADRVGRMVGSSGRSVPRRLALTAH